MRAVRNHAGRLKYAALLFGLLSACDGDSGGEDDPMGARGCPGNANVEPSSAVDLPAGQVQKGFLCPIGNQHWFRIQVPAGQPVVAVELRNDTPLSAVKLSYTLRDGDGMTPIDQSPPPVSSPGKQVLRFSHCVPKPGAYYLEVRSFGNDAADVRNAFEVSYTTAADPDGGEPQNSDFAGAVALTGMEQRGFVACKGDRDFYKIAVGDNRLFDISLTTAAATPTMNLKYTILDDQKALVAEDAVATGTMATNLRVVRVAPKAGTYYFVVEDQAAGSDIKTAYSLNVAARNEPDGNEIPARNDVPADATSLGTFACGGGASFGKMAYLASRADTDWYKITVTGVGPACTAVLDVSASWGNGGAAIKPQVSLVYPDAMVGMYAGTPCTKDEECRVLGKVCGTCRPEEASCAGDDNRCQYLGNQCDRQADKFKNLHCTGAAVCLPEKFCGALQVAKQQTITSPPTGVRTAQPLVAAATYYLRVRDFQSQGYDLSAPYSLAVRLSTDDDMESREPNNFYSPYNLPDNGLVRSDSFAMNNKIMLGQPVRGRIAYERDQDFFVFDHPCPGADCTLKVTYSTSQASRVYYTYQVEVDGGLIAGWPAERPRPMPPMAPTLQSTNGTFGGADTDMPAPTTCFYASKRKVGPMGMPAKYYLWVSDLLKGGPLWDQDTSYTFTITKVQDGCSTECKKAPFNCGQ